MIRYPSQKKTNTIWFHLYVESNEQNKQNRNVFIDTGNTLTVVRGRGLEDWIERVKGLSKEKNSDKDNIMVITRGKGDKMRWNETWLGMVNTIQYIQNVSQNCIHEAHLILLTNVTTINLIKLKNTHTLFQTWNSPYFWISCRDSNMFTYCFLIWHEE